ncbi:MAG: hypothetical protein APR53_09605 [Methanoculleus sp. SDB]|nr:MAG: hypothetical protein APR53_09605 [Methanoculleus sp. SDB]
MTSGADILTGMSKHRIEALSDGIYAIAFTLAMLNIGVGDLAGGTPAGTLHPGLFGLAPQMLHYAIAFFTPGAFWIGHTQQFHSVRQVDRGFLWWNILSLLCVGLLPFSTSLVGDYSSSPYAVSVFALNMCAIGSFNALGWRHALAVPLTDPERDADRAAGSLRRTLVIPVLSLAVIGVAFVASSYATLVYLAAPLVLARLRR